MKQTTRGLLLAGAVYACAALAACTTAQTDSLIAGLGNFNRGLAAVDDTLANVNAGLYKNCTAFVSVAQAINDLSGQCSKAAPYTSTANAVINNYCQTAALAQNGGIVTSISVTASSITAAKSQLAANKQACQAGGG